MSALTNIIHHIDWEQFAHDLYINIAFKNILNISYIVALLYCDGKQSY